MRFNVSVGKENGTILTRRWVLRGLPGMAIAARLWPQEDVRDLSDPELTQNLLSGPGPTFRIPARKDWSIIAYGDQRFTDPANVKVANPKVRRWLVSRIAEERPDALLLSGDVPYDGSVANDYEVYRGETSAWREKKINVYPAMGNHELRGSESREPRNWWNAFPELNRRRWYSVLMGEVYILTLDSNLSLLPGSRQHNWLADQIAQIPTAAKFVFVSLHHPPVADGIENDHSHDVRPNEHALALLLEKSAAGSSARFVVIAGHIHNYERFLEQKVTYLVCGGGGAKPAPVARTQADLYQDASFPNYHYVKFIRDQHQLSAQMFRVQDPDADHPLWIEKDAFVIS